MQEPKFEEFEPIFNQQFNIGPDDLLRTPLSRNLSLEDVKKTFDTIAYLIFGENPDSYSPIALGNFIENKHLIYRNFSVLKAKLFEFLTFSCKDQERSEMEKDGFFENEIADTMEAVRTGIFLAKGIKDNVYAYVTLPDMGLTPPDVIDVAIGIAKVFYGETIEPEYFDYFLGRHNWKKMTGEMLAAECLNAAVDHALDRRKS